MSVLPRLCCHYNHLEIVEQHWCLPPTLRYSDLIGLGDNLGVDNFYNPLDDSNVQSSVQTTHLGYLFFF